MTIHTLIPDIYDAIQTERVTEQLALGHFGTELNRRLTERAEPRDKVSSLRLSQMGECCEKQLWYSVHQPGSHEPLPAYTRIKFWYGDILESLAIELAKSAGHEVTGEQDAVTVDGVTGHRDCVVDGCIVDVKSANSLSFQKIKSGQVADDPFLRSYLDQLDGYLVGSLDDPLVRVKDTAYLLAIDKTLGHLTLYQHKLRERHIRERIKSYKEIVAKPTPPSCTCGTVVEDNGNIRLDTKASYNGYKYSCNPGLRTFIYAKGPMYFTKVVKTPMYKGVPLTEVDKNGKIVYNV